MPLEKLNNKKMGAAIAYLSRIFVTALCVGCLGFSVNADTEQQAAIDQSFAAVATAVADAGLAGIIQIDHSRLAAAASVEMPPSRVQLFSDPKINSAILKEDIRAGIDLPFRALSFDNSGVSALSYTSSDFLAQRHGLSDADALFDFDSRMSKIFEPLKAFSPEPAATKGVKKGFAIIELQSNYDVQETAARLKKIVTAQSDTIWFGEIDFQKEAAENGVALVPAHLLLFGGPAPGGVAMADFPAIGLDAFCQKLLVYEGDTGKAVVLFNDIAALANFHYGHSIEPHKMLNKRLTATFKKAIN